MAYCDPITQKNFHHKSPTTPLIKLVDELLSTSDSFKALRCPGDLRILEQELFYVLRVKNKGETHYVVSYMSLMRDSDKDIFFPSDFSIYLLDQYGNCIHQGRGRPFCDLSDGPFSSRLSEELVGATDKRLNSFICDALSQYKSLSQKNLNAVIPAGDWVWKRTRMSVDERISHLDEYCYLLGRAGFDYDYLNSHTFEPLVMLREQCMWRQEKYPDPLETFKRGKAVAAIQNYHISPPEDDSQWLELLVSLSQILKNDIDEVLRDYFKVSSLQSDLFHKACFSSESPIQDHNKSSLLNAATEIATEPQNFAPYLFYYYGKYLEFENAENWLKQRTGFESSSCGNALATGIAQRISSKSMNIKHGRSTLDQALEVFVPLLGEPFRTALGIELCRHNLSVLGLRLLSQPCEDLDESQNREIHCALFLNLEGKTLESIAKVAKYSSKLNQLPLANSELCAYLLASSQKQNELTKLSQQLTGLKKRGANANSLKLIKSKIKDQQGFWLKGFQIREELYRDLTPEEKPCNDALLLYNLGIDYSHINCNAQRDEMISQLETSFPLMASKLKER